MGGSSKKQTVGYKYFLGVHMGFCHGPIDKVTRIRVADRIAWEGESTGGQITVDSPSLFGGEEKEGGISGLVDFEFGEPAQDVNDYLQDKQNVSGETVPAYRGIAAAVLRQVYLGTNPYLKPWEFRAQRIHTSTRGAVQWYDDKSDIPDSSVASSSTWDLEQIELSETSSSNSLLSTDSVWVSDDGIHLITVVQSTGTTGKIHIWEMSSPNDLSTLSKTTGDIEINCPSPGGVFSNSAGTRIYALDRGGSFFQIELSTGWDINTATESGSITVNLGVGLSPYGVHFNSDFSYFYTCNQNPRKIFQFSLISNGDILSGITQNSTLDVGLIITNDLSGITGKPDGSKLILTTESAAGTFGFDISNINDISTGVFSEKVTNTLFTIGGDLHAVGSGKYIYHSDLDTIREFSMPLVGSGDMNPAHIIRECLTDTSWGLGYTAADIDDTSFTAAADTLFAEEFGISLLWSQQTPIEDFILDILRHIDGTLYVHPRTGKFTLKLIRDDYTVGSLPILDESNIISISDYKKPTIGELTNYVTVKYWDRSTSEDSAISVQDIALAQQQSSVVSATIPMPGITRGELATRVASRELTALSNPLITCTIIGNREAASLNIGDAFKLSWPKFGLSETIMRVTNAQFGTLTDGRVKIECVQDVFGLPQATFSAPTDSNFVNPTNAPANSPFRLVQEANYWTLIQDQGEDFTIDPLDGYLLTAATTPSADALNYRIWTDESGSYEEKEAADFCPTATITHDFPRATDGVINTVVGITGLATDDVDDIDIGSIAQIGNELLEVVAVSTTDATFGRAVADSAIEDHSTGDRIFFWGNSFYGAVGTLYQDNDTIGVKITPLTAQGSLDVSDATEQMLTFDQRAYRAWLPGNLTLNSVYFPYSVEGVETVDSAWAHRDRTLQTAGLNDFTESSIGPEVGTTYTTTLTRVNNSAQLDQNTGVTGTTDSLDPSGYDGLVRYSIVSVRDSLNSYYAHEHEFVVTRTSAVQEEQCAFMLTEDNEAIITES